MSGQRQFSLPLKLVYTRLVCVCMGVCVTMDIKICKIVEEKQWRP